MPIDLDSVGFTTSPVDAAWSSSDALLYALGVGAGQRNPIGSELESTTENSAASGITQRVLPTFPFIVSVAESALDRVGDFDRQMMIHGEQAVEVHGSIPSDGAIVSTTTIIGIHDKGSGALVVMETSSDYKASGLPAFTTRSGAFLRGEGGFGASVGEPLPNRIRCPDRPSDYRVAYQTRPDQALLYRPSGDRNPLHSDPMFASQAGFPKPILHGLCTYGVVGRALLHAICDSKPERFLYMGSRFTKPVVPGDLLITEMWIDEPGRALFRTLGADADPVIDGGELRYRD
jgi:acyl dehydratase